MSSEQPSTEKPTPPKPPSPEQRWRGTRAGANGRPSSSTRGRQLFILIAVLLALGGAITAWLLFLRRLPAPYFLTLPIREYTAKQLAPNAFAVQDSDALLKHFSKDRKRAFSQTLDGIRKELAALRSKGDTPVVVHLTALALRQGDDVFVLPGDADTDRPDTWLPLREVLSALHACPSNHKLLLLDIMKPLADPQLGVLVDDVAVRVKTLVEKENDSKLLVLCACEGNQISLVSEEGRLSSFAYYLDQGLRGHADGVTGNRDGWVSVKELATYVRERVGRWAWQTQLVRQTPVLLGAGDDFPLVSYDESQLQPTQEPGGNESHPAWLRAAWEVRAKSWRDGKYRLAPLSFRRFEAALLRSEQRWRGGKEEVEADLKIEMERFDEQLKLAESAGKKKPKSLLLSPSHQGDPKLDADMRRALRILLDKVDAGGDPKTDDRKAAAKNFLDKFAKVDHAHYAWVIFDTAAELTSPTAERIVLLHGLLEKRAGDGRYTETVFFERLKAFHEKAAAKGWGWPIEKVQRALRVFRQAESTAAEVARDPFVVPWIKDLFQSADDKRREGEKYLFLEKKSQWGNADAPLREAGLAYDKLQKRIKILQAARRQWDRALSLLPGAAAYLAYGPPQGQEELAWKNAILSANKLADWLMTRNPQVLEADDDPTPRAALQERLNALERLLGERVRRTTTQADAAEDFVEIQALLSCPWLEAKEREALWRAGRKLEGQLHAKRRDLDRAEDTGRRSADSQIPGEDAAALRNLALRRARLSIDLALLSGMKEARGLEQELEKLRERADAPWQPLARSLREFWVNQLPGAFEKSGSKMPLADRLGRVLPPLQRERERVVDPRLWSRNPTGYLHNEHVIELWNWLGARYRRESVVLRDEASAATFYEEAAANYLN